MFYILFISKESPCKRYSKIFNPGFHSNFCNQSTSSIPRWRGSGREKKLIIESSHLTRVVHLCVWALGGYQKYLKLGIKKYFLFERMKCKGANKNSRASRCSARMKYWQWGFVSWQKSNFVGPDNFSCLKFYVLLFDFWLLRLTRMLFVRLPFVFGSPPSISSISKMWLTTLKVRDIWYQKLMWHPKYH